MPTRFWPVTAAARNRAARAGSKLGFMFLRCEGWRRGRGRTRARRPGDMTDYRKTQTNGRFSGFRPGRYVSNRANLPRAPQRAKAAVRGRNYSYRGGRSASRLSTSARGPPSAGRESRMARRAASTSSSGNASSSARPRVPTVSGPGRITARSSTKAERVKISASAAGERQGPSSTRV